jgi:hypothetical protein
MKKLAELIIPTSIMIMFSMSSALSFELLEQWSTDYSPELKATCSSMDQLCLALCDNEFECTIPVKTCKDCVGTSILMTNIFDRMGLGYRNSGKDVDSSELIELIRSGDFVTFTSKSVYNQTDSFDSAPMKARFKTLCPRSVDYPVVFFSLKEKSSIINEVKYVACGSDIYEMTSTPDVINGLKPLRVKFSVF